MKTYLDCWIEVATSLLPQALAGAPEFAPSLPKPMSGEPVGWTATLNGDLEGEFSVVLDSAVLDTPLLGDGVEQRGSWGELLREVASAAAGEMLPSSGVTCHVEKFEEGSGSAPVSRAFALKGNEHDWPILVRDRVRASENADPAESKASVRTSPESTGSVSSEPTSRPAGLSAGTELLLDVELDAALRFGSRELPLGEILDLGPGDVVQLDRQVAEPVDLIVADKIVARGEVVLVNGYFGLRVTEVSAPRKRLESIRCLF